MYESAERFLTGYMYGRLINATELDLIHIDLIHIDRTYIESPV